jgi:hypothetical protein
LIKGGTIPNSAKETKAVSQPTLSNVMFVRG